MEATKWLTVKGVAQESLNVKDSSHCAGVLATSPASVKTVENWGRYQTGCQTLLPGQNSDYDK